MTDLEKAISLVEAAISHTNEELGDIDKDATDYIKRVNSLKIDKYKLQHALYLLKSHKSLNNK